VLAVASNRIDLVYEHNAGRLLLGGCEECAHAAAADTNVQLLELRTSPAGSQRCDKIMS
jgi:hypothetical protein